MSEDEVDTGLMVKDGFEGVPVDLLYRPKWHARTKTPVRDALFEGIVSKDAWRV